MDILDASQSQPTTSEPSSDTSVPIPDLSSLMDSPSPVTPEPSSDTSADPLMTPPSPPPEVPPEKKSHKGVLMAILLFFLISVPVIGVFVSQRANIADLRNLAVYNSQPCNPLVDTASICQNGDLYKCQSDLKWHLESSGICGTDSTPTPVPQCVGNEEKCEGGNKFVCSSGVWTNIHQTCSNNTFCPLTTSSNSCGGKSPGSPCTNITNPGSCQFNSAGTSCSCIISQCVPSYCVSAAGGDQACHLPMAYQGDSSCPVTGVRCVCGTGGGGNPTSTPTPTPPPGVTITIEPTQPPNQTPQPTSPGGGNDPTPTNPPGNTVAPTATRTPTPNPSHSPTPVIGQCQNIKIYKNDVVIVPGPTTLAANDVIKIAVAGTNATEARIKINNELAWRTSTTKNTAGEWTFDYTIPSTGVTTFTIIAELFIGGVWQ